MSVPQDRGLSTRLERMELPSQVSRHSMQQCWDTQLRSMAVRLSNVATPKRVRACGLGNPFSGVATSGVALAVVPG